MLWRINWQLRNRINAIGTIDQGRLFAVGLFDCKVNSDVFHFGVKEFLIPELPKKSIIVMDNAIFHKRADTQELLEQNGHKILWLPTYSSDLNPIEKMWAWVKRKRKERLIDFIDLLFKKVLEIKRFHYISRRGNCWDNAVAEPFFSGLKKERIKKRIYKTREMARADVFDYIEMFYN